jgi:CheY-like chemotaxis protein
MLLRATFDCDVEACNEPTESFDIAGRFEPHLVLLDVAMPGMTGFEVARQLRELDIPPFLLVARTGFVETSIRERCLNEGFNYVVAKPGLDELMRLIEAAQRLAEV